MTGRAARTVLAKSILSHVERGVERSRTTHYAVVRQVTPLEVELGSNRLLLTDDDLVVSQWVRRYGYEHGLQVGDTVLVSHMPNDDFVVHDVIATAKVEAGLDSVAQVSASSDPVWSGTAPAGGGAMSVTASHHIIKKVPYLDETGAVVGYVPIYGSLA